MRFIVIRCSQLGNAEGRLEAEFFGGEPLCATLLNKDACEYKPYKLELAVDEYVRRLRESLVPMLERCQRMVQRSLAQLTPGRRAMTVHNDGTLNIVGQSQLNLAAGM